jgi:hypothetical protein
MTTVSGCSNSMSWRLPTARGKVPWLEEAARETLPALIGLIDNKEERVRPYALSGLCLFVRNAPTVTPESVPSMPWLQTRPPTPFLNPETQRCLLGGLGDQVDLDAYANFWKSWWSEHQTEIEKR